MSLEQARELVSHGQYEEALRLLDGLEDENSTSDKDYLQAKIHYHQGDLKAAVSLCDHYESYEMQSLATMIRYDLGDLTRANEQLQQLNQKSDLISIYHVIAQAAFEDKNGEPTRAEALLVKAQNMTDATPELSIVHYKMANLYRNAGLLNMSLEHLKKSISLASDQIPVLNHASSLTTIGQQNLVYSNYEEAQKYLIQSLEHWEQIGNPFGLSWALGELAVVYILQGKYDIGLETLVQNYQVSRNHVSTAIQSIHLLNIVHYSVQTGKIAQGEKHLQFFEELLVIDDPSYPAIRARYEFARGMLASASERISEKLSALEAFGKLHNEEDFHLRINALVRYGNLLLLEINITEDTLIRDNLLHEAEEINNSILHHIQKKFSILTEMISAPFRAALDILRLEPDLASGLIDESIEKADRLNIKLVEEQLRDFKRTKFIEERQINIDQGLDKRLHSIPKLKIMLYLLSRSKVSFSELQQNTGLSSGNLNGQMKKLEELGYIIKEPVFLDERPISVFSITSLGFQEFRNYSQNLVRLLENFP